MSLRSFAQWKARTLDYLIMLKDKVQEQDKAAYELLIFRLENLRVAWLSTWLRDCYLISKSLPEVLQTLPLPQEIEAWMAPKAED